MIAFDIETIPNEQAIQSDAWKKHKEKKGITDDSLAALHPAFCQVVCICAYDELSQRKFSECGPDEKEIISNFFSFVSESTIPVILGGHNIKGFDIPVTACRAMANGIGVISPFAMAGKKPWEIPHVDSVDIMKFGGGPYMSLDAMCFLFGVDSPKNGPVSATGVWDAFKAGDYEGIKKYCGKDVNAWLNCKRKLFALGGIV